MTKRYAHLSSSLSNFDEGANKETEAKAGAGAGAGAGAEGIADAIDVDVVAVASRQAPPITPAPGSGINYVPLAMVFLSGIGFSIQTLFIKLLNVDYGFSGSFEIIFIRGLIQMVIAMVFIHYAKEEDKDVPLFGGTNRIRFLLFLRSFFGYLGIAFAFLSVELLPLGDATVLVMLSPVAASMGSFIMLGEPWRFGEFLATIVSLTGVVLVSRPPFIFGGAVDAADPIGVVYALISALSAGVAYTLVRMLGTTAKVPWANVCFAQAIGQVVLSPPSLLLSGESLSLTLPASVCSIIFVAGFIGAWSQISMTIGMQREKSALATGMRMSDVIAGFTWQFLFTTEAISGLSISGAFLVVVSVLMLIGSKTYYDRLTRRGSATAEELADSSHPGASALGLGNTYSALHSYSLHNSSGGTALDVSSSPGVASGGGGGGGGVGVKGSPFSIETHDDDDDDDDSDGEEGKDGGGASGGGGPLQLVQLVELGVNKNANAPTASPVP